MKTKAKAAVVNEVTTIKPNKLKANTKAEVGKVISKNEIKGMGVHTTNQTTNVHFISMVVTTGGLVDIIRTTKEVSRSSARNYLPKLILVVNSTGTATS